MEIVGTLSILQIIMTIYNIVIFTVVMKSCKENDELREKNKWQAKKIRELAERIIK